MKPFLALSLVASIALVSLTSLADIPPPNSGGCNGKKAGDTCTDDDHKSGTCTTATRSRMNLAARFQDGAPPTTQEPYLMCAAAVGAPGASSSATPTPGSGAEKKGGCSTSSSTPNDGAVVVLGAFVALAIRRRKSRG